MSHIVREPIPTDYSAAIELVSQELEENGGVWVAVMRPEIAAQDSFEQLKLLNAMARIAIHAKVSLEGGGVADFENPVQAARAYRYGMQMGSRIVSVLYSDQIDDGNIMYGYAKLFEANKSDTNTQSDESAALLESLGDLGLESIDEISIGKLQQWAEDAGLKDFGRQRLFELGVGGVLASAYAVHDAQIQAVSSVILKSHEWNKAIEALTTGEQG